MAKDRKNIFEQMSKFRNSSLTPGSFATRNSDMGSQTRPTGPRASVNMQDYLPPQPEMGFAAGIEVDPERKARLDEMKMTQYDRMMLPDSYYNLSRPGRRPSNINTYDSSGNITGFEGGQAPERIDPSPPEDFSKYDFTSKDYENWKAGRPNNYDPNWKENTPGQTQFIPTSSGQMDRSAVIKARQRQAMIQQNALASMNQGMNSSFIREEDGEGNKSIYGNTGINANNPYFNSFG